MSLARQVVVRESFLCFRRGLVLAKHSHTMNRIRLTHRQILGFHLSPLDWVFIFAAITYIIASAVQATTSSLDGQHSIDRWRPDSLLFLPRYPLYRRTFPHVVASITRFVWFPSRSSLSGLARMSGSLTSASSGS